MESTNKNTEKRICKRFPIKLSAQYVQKNDEEWIGCTISDIGRCGIGFTVNRQESMPIGSSVQLEITIPNQEERIKATGVLIWIKQQKKEMNLMGGVELIKITPEDKWIRIDYV
jgi:c-di-GMP-binding flagellar brake protein YcgR